MGFSVSSSSSDPSEPCAPARSRQSLKPRRKRSKDELCQGEGGGEWAGHRAAGTVLLIIEALVVNVRVHLRRKHRRQRGRRFLALDEAHDRHLPLLKHRVRQRVESPGRADVLLRALFAGLAGRAEPVDAFGVDVAGDFVLRHEAEQRQALARRVLEHLLVDLGEGDLVAAVLEALHHGLRPQDLVVVRQALVLPVHAGVGVVPRPLLVHLRVLVEHDLLERGELLLRDAGVDPHRDLDVRRELEVAAVLGVALRRLLGHDPHVVQGGGRLQPAAAVVAKVVELPVLPRVRALHTHTHPRAEHGRPRAEHGPRLDRPGAHQEERLVVLVNPEADAHDFQHESALPEAAGDLLPRVLVEVVRGFGVRDQDHPARAAQQPRVGEGQGGKGAQEGGGADLFLPVLDLVPVWVALNSASVATMIASMAAPQQPGSAPRAGRGRREAVRAHGPQSRRRSG